MNATQNKVRKQKIAKKNLELRTQLWPELDDDTLWDRTKKKGFTTIPRTMPLILLIMDDLDSGKPVSKTYLALWCRVFDESFIEIKNPPQLAFEAGFTGERAVSVWKTRMMQLKKHGFIDIKQGASGDFNYVLLYNPYSIIKKLNNANLIPEKYYTALFARAQEIGADDLSTDQQEF